MKTEQMKLAALIFTCEKLSDLTHTPAEVIFAAYMTGDEKIKTTIDKIINESVRMADAVEARAKDTNRSPLEIVHEYLINSDDPVNVAIEKMERDHAATMH